MRQSLKTLLADSLDYAGMYPPACLSLEDSFAHYMSYRHHEHAWMLARFVCPADRLVDLESLLETSSSPAMRLSVVGKGHATGGDWLPAIEQDFQRMATFLGRIGGRASIETYERALPADLPENQPGAASPLGAFRRAAGLAVGQTPLVVYEVPPDNGKDLGRTLQQLSLYDSHPCALKLRTGGTQAAAFPSAAAVADFIAACRDGNIPWKATAGLHEPLGELDSRLQVWRFGFLNLFAATILAHVHRLPPERIESILREPEAVAFRLCDASFAWRELSATVEQIAEARRVSLMSFGSCSFDEPIEGLRRLKLLAE